MNVRRVAFAAILSLGLCATAFSQTTTTTETTTTRVEKPAMVTGEVIRLEPGKTIVIRSGGEEVSYVLAPGLLVPAEVQVGRKVSLQIEPAATGGSTVVRRITTTTVGTDGQVREKTEVTRTNPMGDTTTTTTTTLKGKVDTYVPGRSVTIIDSKGGRVTYLLSAESAVPAEMIMGKEVTVYVAPNEKPTPTMTYEIERDGNTVKIKAKAKPQN